MDAVLADEGADFGYGIAVVSGDHIAGHEVGDGIVVFHGWLVMKHGSGGWGLLSAVWGWVGGCCAAHAECPAYTWHLITALLVMNTPTIQYLRDIPLWLNEYAVGG